MYSSRAVHESLRAYEERRRRRAVYAKKRARIRRAKRNQRTNGKSLRFNLVNS